MKKILSVLVVFFLVRSFLGLQADVFPSEIYMDYESQGDKVVIHVYADDIPQEISSFGFEIHYDPRNFRYAGNFSPGELISDFDFFGIHESNPGIIKVGGFTTEGPIWQGRNGDLLTLEFAVHNSTDTEVSVSNLTDDLAGISTRPCQYFGTNSVEESYPVETDRDEMIGTQAEVSEPVQGATPPPTIIIPDWLSPGEWQNSEASAAMAADEKTPEEWRNPKAGRKSHASLEGQRIAFRENQDNDREKATFPLDGKIKQRDIQQEQADSQRRNATESLFKEKTHDIKANSTPPVTHKPDETITKNEPSRVPMILVSLLGIGVIFVMTLILIKQ